MTKKPSESQIRALKNVMEGRPIDAHIRGRSAHGGFSGTIVSLHRRGWINSQGDITESGRVIIGAATETPQG